jgi:hypothetical protein
MIHQCKHGFKYLDPFFQCFGPGQTFVQAFRGQHVPKCLVAPLGLDPDCDVTIWRGVESEKDVCRTLRFGYTRGVWPKRVQSGIERT